MLKSQAGYKSPEIERLIREIEDDDARYERELRSVVRQRIILPVIVRSLNGRASVNAFSRNLSPAGISLITDRRFSEGMMTRLQIYRLSRPTSELVAECKWSKPFGREYWMSGWEFLRLANQDA